MSSIRQIRILVVEDHAALAANLQEFFSADDYLLDFAADGLTALHLIATQDYDVIVLDIMLPGLSGIEICRRLRADLHCATPVIMLTAKDSLHDKELGFLAGADDYLVKPFKLRELQLRVEALFRRHAGFGDSVIRLPGLSFEPSTLLVQMEDGPALELGGTPARVFEVLARAYPGHVGHAELRSLIWGDREVDINTVRTHIYMLRKQLQEALGHPLVRTLHGRGYCLVPPADDAGLV